MKRKTVLLAAVAVCVVAAAAGGLVFVKKYRATRGFVYQYNIKHPTAGDLPAERNPQGKLGADGVVRPVSETLPANLKITEKIRYPKNGQIIIQSDPGAYVRENPIFFTKEKVQGTIDGIFTFRGNYHRTLSSYGIAEISLAKFSEKQWTFRTGKLLKSNGKDYWSGNGWTGQPLVIRWPEATKQVMNLYPDKKNKKDLVEVIYSGMDGRIHFLDMEDGTQTRPDINIGMVFKGTASLYPTGIPMIALGSGDSQPGMFGENVSPRAYIYSLIDGTCLYSFGYNDPIAPRIFHAYDSSPVFDAETDTLIYPGENGVVYTMHLNTQYDEKAGTLSIAPDNFCDFTYTTGNGAEDEYARGMENSASVDGNYCYVGDNGGVFYCLDLNTMSMVWAQDLFTDVNSSPIFSEEADGKYLYVATTCLSETVDRHHIGKVAVFKLNAATGSIVWKKEFECHNVEGVEGGVLATGVLGTGVLEGKIIYSVSRCPELTSGILICLDTENGEVVWKKDLSSYGWSSTVTVYAKNGKAYLVQCLANGTVLLLDAADGTTLDSLNLNATLEATPVVFENTLILGTRDRRIIGITLE